MKPLREPLRVATIFSPGRAIRPVWFEWRRKKCQVRETTYAWQEKTGQNLFLHYCVTDGETLYELVYDTGSQSWFLTGFEAAP